MSSDKNNEMSDWTNDETFLARWIEGELSDSQMATFRNHVDFEAYQKLKSDLSTIKVKDIDTEALYQRFNVSKIEKQQHAEAKVITIKRRRFLYVSAAAILLLIAGYFSLFEQTVNVQTAYGEQTKHTLPDGSVVTLNAGSQLSYKKRTYGKDRTVELNGEAFFDVQKDEVSFIVVTTLGNVQVLGTSFNVNAHGSVMDVACKTGRVLVGRPDDGASLTANQRVRYGENTSPVVIESIPADYIGAWEYGESKYISTPFKDVCLAIEMQFGIEIVIKSNVSLNEAFTGSFLHSDVDTALEMVCAPMGHSFNKTGAKKYEVL